jgi:phage head maturation protease
MKHIKTFETKEDEKKKEKYQVELFAELLNENPLNEDHDFYMFIAKESFTEEKGGLYKKTIEIENMVRMTPDIQSIMASKGLEMRARFQHDSYIYHIWLPKELREEVEGKGINLDPWLVELIDKYKMKGGDSHGRQVYNDVVDRKNNISKFNI